MTQHELILDRRFATPAVLSCKMEIMNNRSVLVRHCGVKTRLLYTCVSTSRQTACSCAYHLIPWCSPQNQHRGSCKYRYKIGLVLKSNRMQIFISDVHLAQVNQKIIMRRVWEPTFVESHRKNYAGYRKILVLP